MFDVSNTILLVIDVQEKLLPVIYQKEKLIENLQKLIKGIQVLDIPVIVTEQYPQGLGATVTEIAGLIPDIKPLPKLSFSCYVNDNFKRKLDASGRKQILVSGIETHVCIYQTARDLRDAGYEVQVVTDAVSSRTPENIEISLNLMRQLGVLITGTETALFELLKTAGGEKFKAISRIVK
jgi:nicotinamidase-related amidase